MPVEFTTIPDRHDRSGSKTRKHVRVTGPASYATGGEALSFGLSRVEIVLNDHPRSGTSLRVAQWDYANSRMMWFDFAGTEIADTTDLSAFSCRAEVIGL